MVCQIFEEKNKDLELLLPVVAENENKPKSKFLNHSEGTERQAYFKGDGIIDPFSSAGLIETEFFKRIQRLSTC